MKQGIVEFSSECSVLAPFIEELNRRCKPEEYFIDEGRILRKKARVERIEYPLLVCGDGRGLSNMIGCDDERQIGTITRESVDTYDYLILKVTRSSQLFSLVNQPFKIELYEESSEGSLASISRHDFVRSWGIWKRADLRSVIPSSLFHPIRVQ